MRLDDDKLMYEAYTQQLDEVQPGGGVTGAIGRGLGHVASAGRSVKQAAQQGIENVKAGAQGRKALSMDPKNVAKRQQTATQADQSASTAAPGAASTAAPGAASTAAPVTAAPAAQAPEVVTIAAAIRANPALIDQLLELPEIAARMGGGAPAPAANGTTGGVGAQSNLFGAPK